jgi:uncharacterized protein (DUF4415 family)
MPGMAGSEDGAADAGGDAGGDRGYRKQRGRLAGSDKESTTIRFDRDVLAAFRAGGPGWQTDA